MSGISRSFANKSFDEFMREDDDDGPGTNPPAHTTTTNTSVAGLSKLVSAGSASSRDYAGQRCHTPQIFRVVFSSLPSYVLDQSLFVL